MEVRNCRSCKRLFNYLGGSPLCPACREDLEKKFMEVKEYIREHKGAGIKQVAQECETTENQLRQWVREERLEFAADSGEVFHCEQCGAPIHTGRFCEACKKSMATNLGNLYKAAVDSAPEKRHRDGDKMRFSRG